MLENQPALLFFSQIRFLPTLYSISLSPLSVFSYSLLKTSSSLLKMSLSSSFSSLFGCRALRDAKNPPHFQSSTSRVSLPRISKTFSLLSLKCLLYQKSPSSSAPPHSSSPSALELQLIQLLIPITRWAAAPHKSPLLTPQESTWIWGRLQSTRKQVYPIDKILKFYKNVPWRVRNLTKTWCVILSSDEGEMTKIS